MGLPWSPAPGFTCQLWWIFSFHLCCSKLLGQCWRQKMEGRWEEGAACEWGGRKGGDKALAAFNELDQSPHHLPASTICPGAYITMSAPDKSQIPTHQQQIGIGIPFMSHHMPSYPLQQKRAPSGWMGGQNFLTSLSPWKELAPFWIHKGELPFVYLNIKRG